MRSMVIYSSMYVRGLPTDYYFQTEFRFKMTVVESLGWVLYHWTAGISNSIQHRPRV